MELTKTDFLNSKNIKLSMVVSYEKDKLRMNDGYQIYVTFYLRREKDGHNDFMLGRYYLNTLLEGKSTYKEKLERHKGLCLDGSDPHKYFVDDQDMIKFRAEYRIIKKVVNKLKGVK